MQMDRTNQFFTGAIAPRSRPAFGLVVLATLLLGWQAPARSALVFKAPDIVAGPGVTSFDIVATNEGSTSVSVSSVALDVRLSGSGTSVQFTSVSFPNGAPGQAPYIFNPSFDQDFQLPLAIDVLPTEFTTLDSSSNSVGFVNFTPNAAFTLAHVTFTVASNAQVGPYLITFGTGTSYADNASPTATDIVPGFTSGSITVSAVPEPSSLVLASIGLMTFGGHRLRKQREHAG